MTKEIKILEKEICQLNKNVDKSNLEIDILTSKLELKFLNDASSTDITIQANTKNRCINFYHFLLKVENKKKISRLVNCGCESSCECEYTESYALDDEIILDIHPQRTYDFMMNTMAIFEELKPTYDIDFYVKNIHTHSDNLSILESEFTNYLKAKEDIRLTSLNVQHTFKTQHKSIRNVLYKIHIQIAHLNCLRSEISSKNSKLDGIIKEKKIKEILMSSKRHSENVILKIKKNLANNKIVELNVMDIEKYNVTISKIKIVPENKNNLIAKVFTGATTSTSISLKKEINLNNILKKSIILQTNKVLSNNEISKDIEDKIKTKITINKGQKFHLDFDTCLEYLNA